MEVIRSSKMLVLTGATWCHIPEDGFIHSTFDIVTFVCRLWNEDMTVLCNLQLPFRLLVIIDEHCNVDNRNFVWKHNVLYKLYMATFCITVANMLGV
jgi:hypothetical protein